MDYLSGLPVNDLGRTGRSVSRLCFGTAPIGGEKHFAPVTEEQAMATIDAIFDSPINFIDTSNSYGQGRSERLLGRAIARRGGLPPGAILASKVDPTPGPRVFEPGTRDFSGAQVRRSMDESLERLGLQSLPLVYLHDPELFPFDELTASGGAVDALIELKRSGVAESIGVAGGDLEELGRYLELGVFDVLLNHNRYTLVDQSALPVMRACSGAGVAFVNAAPFGGGILAMGEAARPTYKYQPVSDQVRARISAATELFAQYGADLRTAALQFSLRQPLIASTVVGTSRPEGVESLLSDARSEIPESAWSEWDDCLRRLMTNPTSSRPRRPSS